jgi:hypothetical protein
MKMVVLVLCMAASAAPPARAEVTIVDGAVVRILAPRSVVRLDDNGIPPSVSERYRLGITKEPCRINSSMSFADYEGWAAHG